MNFYFQKRGQFSLLGKILMVVVVSLVLLLFSTNLFGIIKEMSFKSSCQASAVASSVTNVATMGSDVVKLDCPIKYVSLQKDNKKPITDDSLNYKVINVDKPFGSGELTRLKKLDYYKSRESSHGEILEKELGITKEERYLFRINEAVAKEMRDCWDNMGRGKLNLFSAWFDYLGTKADGNWIQQKIPHKLGAPTVCVICSRIIIESKLYSDIEKHIQKPDISDYNTKPNSFIFWLTHNPVPKTSMSYYEYLLDDVNDDIFGYENRNYEYTNEPMAVIFARTNVHVLGQLSVSNPTAFSAVLSIFTGGIVSKAFQTAGIISGGADIAKSVSNIASGKGSISAMYLVPYTAESINEICSALAN